MSVAAHWLISGVLGLTETPSPPLPPNRESSDSTPAADASTVTTDASGADDLPQPPTDEDALLERLPPPPLPSDAAPVLPDVETTPSGMERRPAETITDASRKAAEPYPISHAADRGRVRWIGPMGAVGVGVAIIGISSVAVGTFFLRRGRTTAPDPADESLILVRDYDRPGWMLYGIGLGVTAIGGTLLAIDVTVGRERRIRRLAIRPRLGLDGAGIQIQGRF